MALARFSYSFYVVFLTTCRRIFVFIFIVVVFIAPIFPLGKAHAQNAAKTTRTRSFNKPVFFDPSEEDVLSRPQVAYKLIPQIPGELTMGPVAISERSFFFEYKTPNELFGTPIGKAGVGPKILFMAWPKDLFTEGKIEMISSGGRVVWKQDFNYRSFEDFQRWVDDSKIRTPRTTIAAANTLSLVRLKVEGLEKETFWKDNPAFRICITQTNKDHYSRLCSRTLRTRSAPEGVILGKLRPEGDVRVMVNNQPAPFEAAMDVTFASTVSFYAKIATGETFEFYSQPKQIDLADFSYNPKTESVELVGYDYFPFTKYTLINQKTYSDFVEKIGFEQTIGDSRRFWRANLKRDNNRIYFPGTAGGIFGYLLNVEAFPKYEARPHLSSLTRPGTYKNNTRLLGRKQASSQVSSSQNEALEDSEDPSRFSWYFRATEPAKYNRSEMEVTYEGKTYKSYYELYRGYANEISARLTAVSSRSIVFIGEGAYNLWFEDFLAADTKDWAKQHWGISAKYFRTITPFAARNPQGLLIDTDLTATTVDLKYRFNSGLWTRDETMGVMASYQSAKYNEASATMGGLGWFWARSMPRVIDDFMNLFPTMNYPKWVDVEAIYYTNPLDSDTLLYGNLALNFHGQVLWKPNFFGEAGFGVKRYAFGAKQQNTRADLTIIYATLGLGYKF